MISTMTWIQASFSFLTAGPRFTLDLPADFGGMPQLSTPIHNGFGGRSLTFIPSALDEPLTDSTLVRTLPAAEGRQAQLFERRGSPVIWFLRWPLAAGALYTHLVEEDGIARAQLIADNLGVVEDDAIGLPFALLEGVLRSAASADLGWHEEALFESTGHQGRAIALRRPSYLAESQVVTIPDGEQSGFNLVRVGTSFGLEMHVNSRGSLDDAVDVAEWSAGSLRMA